MVDRPVFLIQTEWLCVSWVGHEQQHGTPGSLGGRRRSGLLSELDLAYGVLAFLVDLVAVDVAGTVDVTHQRAPFRPGCRHSG